MDIVNKHNAKNSTIILCDYTNSIDTLIQIFDRYHIPYTLCSNMNKPQIVYQYQSLVKFMMDPNIDNLSECLYHHVFKKAIDPSLINYLTNNITSIDHLYDRIDYDKLNTLSTDEKQVLQKRHDAFCDYFDSIKDDINLFISCDKLNVLRVAYDYLKDGQDINGINRIADILNNSLNYIRDVDDINIILSQIDKITVNNDAYFAEADKYYRDMNGTYIGINATANGIKIAELYFEERTNVAYKNNEFFLKIWNEDEIDKDYLKMILTSDYVNKQLNAILKKNYRIFKAGSAFRYESTSIDISYIKSIIIPVPSLEKQKELVNEYLQKRLEEKKEIVKYIERIDENVQ